MTKTPPKTYTLRNAQNEPCESKTPGTLGGHKKHRIYGALDCPSAKAWLEKGHYKDNRVFFADEETALSAGYRPCSRCMPDAYKDWKLEHAGGKAKAETSKNKTPQP